MSVAPESLEKPRHLLVNHGVVDHAVIEILFLRGGRQLPVEQQVTGLKKVAVLGELLDGIAAIFQDARVAVDIGNLRLAARGGGETGVIREHAGLCVELSDVDDIRPNGAARNREIVGLVADRQRRGFVMGVCIHREVPDEVVAKPATRYSGTGRRRWPSILKTEQMRSLFLCALQDGAA